MMMLHQNFGVRPSIRPPRELPWGPVGGRGAPVGGPWGPWGSRGAPVGVRPSARPKIITKFIEKYENLLKIIKNDFSSIIDEVISWRNPILIFPEVVYIEKPLFLIKEYETYKNA